MHKLQPSWMLAELTYRCPLSCAYCSNPLDLSKRNKELSTKTWKKVIKNASSHGVCQIGFSGGEPLLKENLEQLVETASSEDMYTNLITSAVGLNEDKLDLLKNCGLDSIQVSFQADTPDLNDYIAKNNVYTTKVESAKLIKKMGFPLTFNIVLHRHNSDRIKEILDFAILELDADYIELANTQFYGWAFENRNYLLPTKSQVEYTQSIADEYREKYTNKCKIFYIYSDYYEGRPKPCMGGWANDFFVVNPEGLVLPCHSATVLPNLEFPQITDENILDIGDIWKNSELFNKFRNFDWMEEPCKSCEFKTQDFGGCRCQAYMLTGNENATDPVCEFSPKNQELKESLNPSSEFVYRK